jgi:hypothetical protein
LSYTVVISELTVGKPERTVAAVHFESGAALMKEPLKRRTKKLETSILKVFVLSESWDICCIGLNLVRLINCGCQAVRKEYL